MDADTVLRREGYVPNPNVSKRAVKATTSLRPNPNRRHTRQKRGTEARQAAGLAPLKRKLQSAKRQDRRAIGKAIDERKQELSDKRHRSLRGFKGKYQRVGRKGDRVKEPREVYHVGDDTHSGPARLANRKRANEARIAKQTAAVNKRLAAAGVEPAADYHPRGLASAPRKTSIVDIPTTTASVVPVDSRKPQLHRRDLLRLLTMTKPRLARKSQVKQSEYQKCLESLGSEDAARLRAIVEALLVRGGIEMNPGPQCAPGSKAEHVEVICSIPYCTVCRVPCHEKVKGSYYHMTEGDDSECTTPGPSSGPTSTSTTSTSDSPAYSAYSDEPCEPEVRTTTTTTTTTTTSSPGPASPANAAATVQAVADMGLAPATPSVVAPSGSQAAQPNPQPKSFAEAAAKPTASPGANGKPVRHKLSMKAAASSSSNQPPQAKEKEKEKAPNGSSGPKSMTSGDEPIDPNSITGPMDGHRLTGPELLTFANYLCVPDPRTVVATEKIWRYRGEERTVDTHTVKEVKRDFYVISVVCMTAWPWMRYIPLLSGFLLSCRHGSTTFAGLFALVTYIRFLTPVFLMTYIFGFAAIGWWLYLLPGVFLIPWGDIFHYLGHSPHIWSEHVMYYIPHIVTCITKKRGSPLARSEHDTTVVAEISRLAMFPLPSKRATIYVHGTSAACYAVFQHMDFTLRTESVCDDGLIESGDYFRTVCPPPSSRGTELPSVASGSPSVIEWARCETSQLATKASETLLSLLQAGGPAARTSADCPTDSCLVLLLSRLTEMTRGLLPTVSARESLVSCLTQIEDSFKGAVTLPQESLDALSQLVCSTLSTSGSKLLPTLQNVKLNSVEHMKHVMEYLAASLVATSTALSSWSATQCTSIQEQSTLVMITSRALVGLCLRELRKPCTIVHGTLTGAASSLSMQQLLSGKPVSNNSSVAGGASCTKPTSAPSRCLLCNESCEQLSFHCIAGSSNGCTRPIYIICCPPCLERISSALVLGAEHQS